MNYVDSFINFFVAKFLGESIFEQKRKRPFFLFIYQFAFFSILTCVQPLANYWIMRTNITGCAWVKSGNW